MVMDPNPYAPTKAALNEVPSLEPIEAAQPASRWRRLANLLLDLVGILLMSLLAGILLGIVSVVTHIDVSDFTGPAFSFSIVVLYYFVSEALFARTLGKLVTGTQVVTESGGPLANTGALALPLRALRGFFFSKPPPSGLARPVVENARGHRSAPLSFISHPTPCEPLWHRESPQPH
jgi:hypothetical protein